MPRLDTPGCDRLRATVQEVIRQCLKSPLQMDLPTWADTYRHLSLQSGAIGGRWKTSRVEVARGPMMAVTEPGVRIITVMTATQLLKTSLLENTLGYFAHMDPCPMLLVEPKDEAVDAFSKERLVPLVNVTPVLRELIGDRRTRNSENTLSFKKFPGGFLAMESAGSPTNLAMRAIRVTLLDEVDKYQSTKEGDPIALAEERSSTFRSNRLSIRACSPTWKETSRIGASYELSDQRRPYLECPHCGWLQTLDFFRHVHWGKKGEEHDPTTAAIWCEACGSAWTEDQRLAALQETRWHQTRPFECCGEEQEPRVARSWDWDEARCVGWATCLHCGRRAVPNRHAGFTASKLYSPFLTVPELATAWLDARKDPESKQTFYNTQLALPFEVEAVKEVHAEALAERREVWEDVPNEVLVITAGVDVHPGSREGEGRIEVEAAGWGLGEESWSLGHEVFTGDPAQKKVWLELDEYLSQPWHRRDGREQFIRGVCVDSGGHNTQEAYAFCRERAGRNIWAVKGASDRGGQWSPIWPSVQRTKRGGNYRPVILGVNAAKEAIRQRLLINKPGPGYCHFPMGRPSAYFDQLTSERLTIERHAGAMVRKWTIPSHRTNEALDLRVYAYAALWGLYTVRRLRLEVLAVQLGEPAAPPVPQTSSPVVAQQQNQGRRVARSSWMGAR